MKFLETLLNGLSAGSTYAMIALGYTMVYGIAKMLNFAHGDVIMVGGYISFCAMSYLGLPSWLAVIMAMAVCTVLGIVIERLAYKPLRSAPSLAVLITAIGVSYLLENLAQLIFGDLYNSRLCNALHAMPVTRGSRFGSHILAGIAFAWIPNLLTSLLMIPSLGHLWYTAF